MPQPHALLVCAFLEHLVCPKDVLGLTQPVEPSQCSAPGPPLQCVQDNHTALPRPLHWEAQWPSSPHLKQLSEPRSSHLPPPPPNCSPFFCHFCFHTCESTKMQAMNFGQSYHMSKSPPCFCFAQPGLLPSKKAGRKGGRSGQAWSALSQET